MVEDSKASAISRQSLEVLWWVLHGPTCVHVMQHEPMLGPVSWVGVTVVSPVSFSTQILLVTMELQTVHRRQLAHKCENA